MKSSHGRAGIALRQLTNEQLVNRFQWLVKQLDVIPMKSRSPRNDERRLQRVMAELDLRKIKVDTDF